MKNAGTVPHNLSVRISLDRVKTIPAAVIKSITSPLPAKDLVGLLRDEKTRDQGFRLAVEQYQQPLYWVIRKLVTFHDDANDVLQNVFIRAWKNLDQFRGDAQIYTWLYRIAVNESLNYLKARKRRATVSIEDGQSPAVERLESEAYVDGSAISARLQEAIGLLPKRQSLVFRLRYLEGMKYEEMAGLLGVTEGALKASYHHAVRKIEAHLTKD